MRQSSIPALIFVFALVLFLLAGCAPKSESGAPKNVSQDNPFKVVATTSMIADLVRIVGDEYVDVEGLMGPGVDPHLYKASEGDVSAMTRADLVFYNGLHLEGKMVDIFEQMSHLGREVHAVSEGLAEERLRESSYFAGNYDPHIWFDVNLWIHATQVISEVLSTQDPAHAQEYDARRIEYTSQLMDLDKWVSSEVSRIPTNMKVLVTSHDAFGYFGRAYGMDVKGLQGLSTATEAGTADVQELARFVAENKIPSMFVESSISPRGIEAVREAVRARGFEVLIGGTLYGDALGSPGSGADNYIGMVHANVETIVNGLTTKSE